MQTCSQNWVSSNLILTLHSFVLFVRGTDILLRGLYCWFILKRILRITGLRPNYLKIRSMEEGSRKSGGPSFYHQKNKSTFLQILLNAILSSWLNICILMYLHLFYHSTYRIVNALQLRNSTKTSYWYSVLCRRVLKVKHQANPYCGEALLKHCKDLITQCCKKKQITSAKVRKAVSLAEELIFFLQEDADQKNPNKQTKTNKKTPKPKYQKV